MTQVGPVGFVKGNRSVGDSIEVVVFEFGCAQRLRMLFTFPECVRLREYGWIAFSIGGRACAKLVAIWDRLLNLLLFEKEVSVDLSVGGGRWQHHRHLFESYSVIISFQFALKVNFVGLRCSKSDGFRLE